MSNPNISMTQVVVVEEEVRFTLGELCRASHARIEQLVALVELGALTPSGEGQQGWRFEGSSLKRARVATRLTRDLELSAAGAALVLDLLDEIESLRSQLRRVGNY